MDKDKVTAEGELLAQQRGNINFQLADELRAFVPYLFDPTKLLFGNTDMVRSWISRQLVRDDDHAQLVAQLISLFRYDDDAVVYAATCSLLIMAHDFLDYSIVANAVDEITGLLSSHDVRIRYCSALLLDGLKDQLSFEPMLKRFEAQNEESGIRAIAAHLLGQLGDKRALSALANGLDDASSEVRQAVAEALGCFMGEEVLSLLLKAMNDPDEYVRENAAYSLGRLENAGAVKALVSALSDVESVKYAAICALKRIPSEQAIEPLIDVLMSGDNGDTPEALANIGEPALTRVVQLLKGQNVKARIIAVHALVSFKANERAVEALMFALKDEDPQVRAEAIWALYLLSSSHAYLSATTMLDDESPVVRRASVLTLGHMGGDEVLSVLLLLQQREHDPSVKEDVDWVINMIEEKLQK